MDRSKVRRHAGVAKSEGKRGVVSCHRQWHKPKAGRYFSPHRAPSTSTNNASCRYSHGPLRLFIERADLLLILFRANLHSCSGGCGYMLRQRSYPALGESASAATQCDKPRTGVGTNAIWSGTYGYSSYFYHRTTHQPTANPYRRFRFNGRAWVGRKP